MARSRSPSPFEVDPGTLAFEYKAPQDRQPRRLQYTRWSSTLSPSKQYMSALMEAKAFGKLPESCLKYSLRDTPFTIKDYFYLSQSLQYGDRMYDLAGGALYGKVRYELAKIGRNREGYGRGHPGSLPYNMVELYDLVVAYTERQSHSRSVSHVPPARITSWAGSTTPCHGSPARGRASPEASATARSAALLGQKRTYSHSQSPRRDTVRHRL